MFERLAHINEWLYHTAAKNYYGLRLIYFKWRARSSALQNGQALVLK